MSQISDDRPDDRWEPSSQPPPADAGGAGGQEGAPYTGTPYTGIGTGTAQRDSQPQRYAPSEGSPTPTSAVVLLIVSGLGALVFVWSGIGIVWAAPVVLAIVAMVRKDQVDLSRRLTKIGWIVYAALAVLTVLLISLAVAALMVFVSSAPVFTDGPYDPGTIAFTTAWLGAR